MFYHKYRLFRQSVGVRRGHDKAVITVARGFPATRNVCNDNRSARRLRFHNGNRHSLAVRRQNKSRTFLVIGARVARHAEIINASVVEIFFYIRNLYVALPAEIIKHGVGVFFFNFSRALAELENAFVSDHSCDH